MSWKIYALSFIATNIILVAFSYLILRLQNVLPFNPNGMGSMEPTLTFNTVISFITNTNLQHYSGESALSYFSQMAVIMMMMFTSAATGFSVAIAFVRGITSKGQTIGNFFEDFVKAHTRIFLPVSFILTLVLVALQVPQTLDPTLTVKTLEGAMQQIAIGPVASLESIKHLGTNGGGFFGVNSAHPFENPNPLTNVIEILSMWALPAALPYTFGLFAKNKKQGWVVFTAMMCLFLVFLSAAYTSEKMGNPAIERAGHRCFARQHGRQGSAVRHCAIRTVHNGDGRSDDRNRQQYARYANSARRLGAAWGNDAECRIRRQRSRAHQYAHVCDIGRVYMRADGRTNAGVSGRKIEPREMKLIAVAILAHPFIILVPTAIAFMTDLGPGAITNPGFHGISQVLYEFTSSAANNGSGFEGLGDNTPFWNISTGLVMLLGRYISMIAMLAVAGSLVRKQPVPETIGTFRTDNGLFTGLLIGTVLLIGALTFLPVIVLGPVAEYLTLR